MFFFLFVDISWVACSFTDDLNWSDFSQRNSYRSVMTLTAFATRKTMTKHAPVSLRRVATQSIVLNRVSCWKRKTESEDENKMRRRITCTDWHSPTRWIISINSVHLFMVGSDLCWIIFHIVLASLAQKEIILDHKFSVPRQWRFSPRTFPKPIFGLSCQQFPSLFTKNFFKRKLNFPRRKRMEKMPTRRKKVKLNS